MVYKTTKALWCRHQGCFCGRSSERDCGCPKGCRLVAALWFPPGLTNPKGTTMAFGDAFKRAKQVQDGKKLGIPADQVVSKIIGDNIITNLGSRGEKLLAQNKEAGEQILAKLKGDFGQGFVVTNRRVLVIKWGFQSGSTFGGKCVSYAYANIAGLHINKQAIKAMVQVLTPATQANVKLTYWGSRGSQNNAVESDYAVTFSSKSMGLFQEAVRLAREQMAGVQTGSGKADDTIQQLEQLAELKQKGALTEQKFAAKKQQLLGL
jgi:hypothetical protein